MHFSIKTQRQNEGGYSIYWQSTVDTKKWFFRPPPVMSFGFLDVIFGRKRFEIDTYKPPKFVWLFSTLLLFEGWTLIWSYPEKGERSKSNIVSLKLWVVPGEPKYHSEKILPQLLDRWYDHSKMKRWGNFFTTKKMLEFNSKRQVQKDISQEKKDQTKR